MLRALRRTRCRADTTKYLAVPETNSQVQRPGSRLTLHSTGATRPPPCQVALLTKSSQTEETPEEKGSEVAMLRRGFEGLRNGIKSWAKYVPWPVARGPSVNSCQAP